MKKLLVCSLAWGLVTAMAAPVWAAGFDGQGDNQIDAYGYYYAITGGKFPNGQTVTGVKATGGSMKFILDDPVWQTWGYNYAIDTWHTDGWFAQTAGLALTMQSGGVTVFDNNGIEDGTCGNFYDATAQGLPSAQTPGLYRGYCMSNKFDWIYAGYFKLDVATSIDTIIGYFDENSGFDRNNPLIKYRMNIWSSYVDPISGRIMPVNTGSFDGDVFCSDFAAGTFTTSDTGVDRVFGVDYGSIHDDIFRLTLALSEPVVLPPGEYFFSHDATIVPEPLTAIGLAGALAMFGGYLRRRRLA